MFRLAAGALAAALVLTCLALPADAAAALPGASTTGPRTTSAPPGVPVLPRPEPRTPKARTTGSLVVTFADGTAAFAEQDAVRDAGARSQIVIDELDTAIVTASNRSRAISELRDDPRVEAVRAEGVRTASDAPDDALLPYQLNAFAVRLPAAWDISHGSSSVDIAILDTGVDLDHPELAGRIVPGYDFVNSDSSPSDDNGHGTMVAGIAAANTNNARGIAGAAWSARVMPIKVLDADGAGSDGDIADGIIWAVDHGAEILNLSFAGPGSSPLLEAAVAYAKSHGRLVVAAAGNEASDVASYPAAIPDVLAVGATDDLGEAVTFTNRGPWVDVVAPGWDVLSTASAAGPKIAHAVASGTSFSSPLVAGVAALVKAKNPAMTSAQIAGRITSTAADRGIDGFDDVNGFGLLDAYAALGGRTAVSPALAPPDGDGSALHARDAFADNEIEAPGDVDWYVTDQPSIGRFAVGVGVLAGSVDTDPQAFTPDVAVFDPDYNRIAVNDAEPGPAASILVPVVKPGRYTIRVRNALSSKTSTLADEYPQYATSITSAWEPLDRVAPIARHGLATSPAAAVTGDFTGDGEEDLLVSTRYGAGPIGIEHPENAPLLLYPHTGEAALPEPVTIATDINVGRADLTSGDLDGDGDQDVVLGGSDGIDIFTMTPGGLTGPTKIPDTALIKTIRIADMDDDGDSDLVYTTWDDVRMRLQDAGAWAASVVVDASPLYTMEADDVTGDGRADVVGGTDVSYGVPGLRVLVQQDDGSFGRDDHPRSYLSSIADVELADVDSDNVSDVLAAVSSNVAGQPKGIEVYGRDGEGGFGLRTRLDAFSTTSAITYADATGDGRPDIVARHPAPTYGIQSGFGVFEARPDGGFEDELVYFAPQGDGVPSHVFVSDVAGGTPNVFITGSFFSSELWQIGPLDVPLLDGRLWVSGVTPSDRDQDVDPLVHPEVTFARPVDASTITAETVRFLDAVTGAAVPGSRSYDAETRTVTIVPSAPLVKGRPYRIAVSGVHDDADATMDEHVAANFTIEPAPAPEAALRSDVNGDGYDDIVTGVPYEDLGSSVDAGAVTVLYGSPTGPAGRPAQQITRETPGVPGASRTGDRFGTAVATGDVNADGYNDVAIGAPGRDVAGKIDAGEVVVLVGSPRGLIATNTSWTQDSVGVPGGAEAGDRFGSAVAFGRFDAARGADLAIGVPGEGVGAAAGAGAVYVLRGAALGLTTAGVQVWTQDSAGVETLSRSGDAFGQVLATGDTEGDANDELAVGMPLEDVSGKKDAGAVVLFRGSVLGLRPALVLTDAGSLVEAGDRFGAAMTFGDIGGIAAEDGYTDLVIGHPGENGVGFATAWYADQGSVGLYGAYIAPADMQPGGGFASAMAYGHKSEGRPVLAIGMPGYDYLGTKDVGKVWLHFGGQRDEDTGFFGLGSGAGGMQQGIDIPGTTETGDRFGTSVAILDVDGDASIDWIVGVPNEGTGAAVRGGEIDVMRWSSTTASDAITQDSLGVPDSAETGDVFGLVIAR